MGWPVPELGLHLRQLLTHLRARSRGVGPVEADRRRALLQPVGLEQRRQGRGDSRERPAPALLPLESFPWLGVAQLEEMRMAPAHLPLEALGDVVRRELAELLGDHQLERQVEQQIAQLVPDGVALALAQRLVELEHLLDQVRTERFAGLRLVPGAPCPEVAHHRQGASKR